MKENDRVKLREEMCHYNPGSSIFAPRFIPAEATGRIMKRCSEFENSWIVQLDPEFGGTTGSVDESCLEQIVD